MSASVQRFTRVSGLTFTPTGLPAVPVDGVSQVTVNPRARTEGFTGDLDLYPRVKVVSRIDPLVTVESIESASFDAVETGARGVLTFVAEDAVNGAAPGGGARRVTVTTAVFTGSARASRHRKRATRSLTFETESADGRTDPVRVVPL